MEARIVLTKSYGASRCWIVRALRATVLSLSQSALTPSSCKRRRAVRISTTPGIRLSRHSSSVSKDAKSKGSAAFLAPLTHTSPCRGRPPRMTIVSILPTTAEPHPPLNSSYSDLLPLRTHDSWQSSIVVPDRAVGERRLRLSHTPDRLALILPNLHDQPASKT